MLEYIVVLGAVIHIAGTLYYVRQTYLGITKPNRVTWFMWALTAFVAYAAAIADGVGLAALPVLMAGIGPLLVFLVSFVNANAYWKLGALDYLCGISATTALVLWVVTSNPVLAILFAIIGETFATAPTLLKAWRFPETETGVSYATASFSMFTGIISVPFLSFSSLAFPLYIIGMNVLLIFGVYRKKILSARSL